MNIYVLIAGILSFIGLLAHAFIGTRETLLTNTGFENKTIEKYWYQEFMAWHLVTADLFLSSVLLILISITNILDDKKTIAFVFALQYAVWTLASLIVLLTTTGRKYFKELPHWIFFLVCSILLFYGMNRFDT